MMFAAYCTVWSSATMKPIDVQPSDLDAVVRILAKHVPEREVWAFGSRAGGTAKQFSDLDLAILGDRPISAGVLADLQEAFRESDLPFKVDVIDWATTQNHFRRIIEKEYVVIHNACPRSPTSVQTLS
jgi:predicted nucleotidyltransferase